MRSQIADCRLQIAPGNAVYRIMNEGGFYGR